MTASPSTAVGGFRMYGLMMKNCITAIDVGADEEMFDSNCETGDQWRPQYDYMLFKKSVYVNYSADRK
ncbi:MAG: hypothetical protein K2L19_09825 [Eubacterium sp.]|nr:hypothetical protein [Eubacterium sp.]